MRSPRTRCTSRLDVAVLDAELQAAGWRTLRAHSQARDRATYLLRPDYGRRLSDDSAAALAGSAEVSYDLVFVVADGLSALAVQRHAVSLLEATRPLLNDAWSIGPIVIVEQGRVAIGDEIGELLRARMIVVLIGERPGLSSPDSLGIYITFAPKLGRTDAERNCISNVRPEGMSYAAAAKKLVWLLGEAMRSRAHGCRTQGPRRIDRGLEMNKTVAVLGGGHGAHAMAVDLTSRGFAVNMYEMPQFAQNLQSLFETRTIESSGEISGRFEMAKVTSDINEAIDEVKYIFVVTPAFAHEGYAKLLQGKGYGRSGHRRCAGGIRRPSLQDGVRGPGMPGHRRVEQPAL